MQAVVVPRWHHASVDEVVRVLRTDVANGLPASEVELRARQYGPNELAEAPPERWWLKLLNQFNQLVIWILIAATILSGILGDWLEAIAIFAIVFLNALLGFFQERKAEKALSSLRKLSSSSGQSDCAMGHCATSPRQTLVPRRHR